jgi:hypothetical protein
MNCTTHQRWYPHSRDTVQPTHELQAGCTQSLHRNNTPKIKYFKCTQATICFVALPYCIQSVFGFATPAFFYTQKQTKSNAFVTLHYHLQNRAYTVFKVNYATGNRINTVTGQWARHTCFVISLCVHNFEALNTMTGIKTNAWSWPALCHRERTHACENKVSHPTAKLLRCISFRYKMTPTGETRYYLCAYANRPLTEKLRSLWWTDSDRTLYWQRSETLWQRRPNKLSCLLRKILYM